MIPKARIEAWEKAPPAKVSNNPSKPFLEAFAWALAKRLGLIPGKTICVPRRYVNNKASVTTILLRSSSIDQIFFRV